MNRRQFLVLAGALAVAGCASQPHVPPTRPSPTPSPSVRYNFQDEFNGLAGAAPNPAKWNLGPDPNLEGGIQNYTSSRVNSHLDGHGHLVITARPDGSGGYTSARLTTLGKFSQMGGWFEARIKVDAGQQGIWPAFWLIGQNIDQVGWPWCGEVDAMEDFGMRPPAFTSTVHVPSDNMSLPAGLRTSQRDITLPSDSGWHTYKVHWDLAGQAFTFYRDGVQYFTSGIGDFSPKFWVYGPGQKNNGGMSIIINLAVGGYVGAPHPASWPVHMYVDYVRAWQ